MMSQVYNHKPDPNVEVKKATLTMIQVVLVALITAVAGYATAKIVPQKESPEQETGILDIEIKNLEDENVGLKNTIKDLSTQIDQLKDQQPIVQNDQDFMMDYVGQYVGSSAAYKREPGAAIQQQYGGPVVVGSVTVRANFNDRSISCRCQNNAIGIIVRSTNQQIARDTRAFLLQALSS